MWRLSRLQFGANEIFRWCARAIQGGGAEEENRGQDFIYLPESTTRPDNMASASVLQKSNKKMQTHVLDEGLNERSLLVPGIDSIITFGDGM